MIFVALLAHGWSLVQLGILSLPWRTVRGRTIALAFGIGFGVVAPLTLLLQQFWMRAYAKLSDPSSYYLKLSEINEKSGYTVDPFIEEFMKILPLVLLLAWPRIGRRLGLVDALVLGAAIGAGFGWAEETMRLIRWIPSGGLYWDATNQSWQIPFLFGDISIPGPLKILSQWIPNPLQNPPTFSFEWLGRWERLHDFHHHLIWSALAGLGIGLLFRMPSPVRYLGGLLWLWASLDHVFVNLVLSMQLVQGLAIIPAAASFLTGFGRWAPLALGIGLGCAWALDAIALQRALRETPELRLPEEQRYGIIGIPLAFLLRPRHQWPLLKTFFQERNGWAYQRIRCAETSPADPWRDALIRVAVTLAEPSAPPDSPPSGSKDARLVLLRRLEGWVMLATGLLISALPTIYFAAASIPGTRGILSIFRQSAFLPVLMFFSIFALLRSTSWLILFYLSWRWLPPRSGGARIVPLVFWGLLVHSALILNLLALFRSTQGPEATLLGVHISDAAEEVLMWEFLLFALAILAFVFGIMDLPLLAFIFAAPGMARSAVELVTGKDFLTGRPLSREDRFLAFLDVLFGFLDLAPPRLARLFGWLEKTRPRRVWIALRTFAEATEESVKPATAIWEVLSLGLSAEELRDLTASAREAYFRYQLDGWKGDLPTGPWEKPTEAISMRMWEACRRIEQGQLQVPVQILDSNSLPNWAQAPFSLQADFQRLKGDLLLLQGDFEGAAQMYQEALSLATQAGSLLRQAEAWSGLGEALLRLRRAEEANTALQKALQLYQQLSVRGAPLAHLLTLLAEAQQQLGALESAYELAGQAFQEAQAVPEPYRAPLLRWMAHRFQEMGLTEWASRCHP